MCHLVPKRQTTIKGRDPVINPTIQNLKNKKSRYYKNWTIAPTLENYMQVKMTSRLLNAAIKREKRLQISKKLSSTPKDYWDIINKMLGKKLEDKITLDNAGISTSNHEACANLFADFFERKVKDIILAQETDHFVVPSLWREGEVVNDNFFFTEQDIECGLNTIKNSKAQGFDEIPGKVLKDLSSVLTRPLTWLFNNILLTGKIPRAWKVSRIVPLHKKGDKKLVNNYRPICNISSLSKLFEKCLTRKLTSIFTFDQLMGTHQHAYREGC